MKHTIITKKEFIKGTSLVEKYQQQEQKDKQYCYKPYRTLSNYLQ